MHTVTECIAACLRLIHILKTIHLLSNEGRNVFGSYTCSSAGRNTLSTPTSAALSGHKDLQPVRD